jgi:purine-nucleoside phosphorylase
MHQATAGIRRLSALRPTLAFVLGSGFREVFSDAEVEATIPFSQIPGFLEPGVGGHEGKLVIALLGETPVLLLQGRSHYYEGHPMEAITFPVRVLAELGIRHLVLTNAAGGIHRGLHPGDFMLIKDHINFMGANPLRGEASLQRERFVDLSELYDANLRKLLRRAATQCRLKVREGVYLAVSGPSYETPAEIRAFARLGADAVGMSTVPEAIVARQCGVGVAGISCITNLAAGRTKRPLSHTEVLAMGKQSRKRAAALLQSFVELYAETNA